ncbi:MAG: succinylglutamate desuccinylase/aspartoacylase family protein [Streptosporangiaceae bacterium]
MPSTVRRRTLDLAGVGVPVVELTGTEDGPRLTVIAGVHGCEYASITAVRQWSASLAGRDLRGRVTVVPVLNMPACSARSPFVVPEDGKNLNRCFPGDPGGTLADQLAHATFTQLIEGSDALIDAHCGDLPEALEPFALYEAGPAQDKALALAVAYGLGYIIRQEAGPGRAVAGTTSAAAAAAGIPAITAEAGGCGLIEQAAVELHVRGLDRVLGVLGITGQAADGEAGPSAPAGREAGPFTPADGQAPVVLSRFLWLRCEAAGWWQPVVRPGEQVDGGQLLGTVATIDGERVLQSIHAPAAGVPMFITSSPAVEAGGLLLGLGAA